MDSFGRGDKKGTYTVRANVSLLEGNADRIVPVHMIWNSCVPPKVCGKFGGEKCLPWSNLKRGVSKWLAGARCGDRLMRCLIIFWSTAPRLGDYGRVLFLSQALIGCALFWLRI